METYWLRECQRANDVKLFESVWGFLKHVTNRKAANFKYKLIHHILPCQKMLKRWEISDTDTCVLCNVIEDYKHLFLHCQRVSNVLNELNTHALLKFKMHVNFKTLNTLIFGYKIRDQHYFKVNEWVNTMYYNIFCHYCKGTRNIIDERQRAIFFDFNGWVT